MVSGRLCELGPVFFGSDRRLFQISVMNRITGPDRSLKLDTFSFSLSLIFLLKVYIFWVPVSHSKFPLPVPFGPFFF